MRRVRERGGGALLIVGMLALDPMVFDMLRVLVRGGFGASVFLRWKFIGMMAFAGTEEDQSD